MTDKHELHKTTVWFGKERQRIGHEVEVAIHGTLDNVVLVIDGYETTTAELVRLLFFAVQRQFQNLTNNDKTAADVKETWREVEKNLREHGRVSASAGQRGNAVESRAKALVARKLQESGMTAKEAVAAVAAIWQGTNPAKYGLDSDIQSKARDKARQLLEAERQLLESL